MASSPNVLRVNAVEEQAAYRTAVAKILRNVQTDKDVTLLEIADAVDVSLGTISNAANKKTDLNATYLTRIGQAFGPEYLDPYAALTGGRMVPLDAQEKDALPSLTAAVHKIALARTPDSPGGIKETHSEILAMLPELRDAQSAISHLIARAERIAA